MNPRTGVRDYRPLIAVSAPIAGIQLAQVALTTTDLTMMGLMSVEAIAAGGLAITLYNQLRTMCVGMVTAVGNLVASSAARGEDDRRSPGERLGGKAEEEVRQVVRSAFLVATAMAVLGAGILIGLGYAMVWFGQSAHTLELARPAIVTLAPGLIPMLWLNVLRQFAVGMRRPGSLLWVTLASIAVNAALDGAFIYGWMGMPRLGLAGIGLATTLVQFVNFFAFAMIVRRDRQLRHLLSLRGWKADIRTVREIVRLGVPICLTYGSEAGITSVATVLMGTFGPAMLAAHNIVNQLAYIAYQFNIGISQGSSILISRAASKNDPAAARTIAGRAMRLSAVLMALFAVFYLVAPSWALWLFLDHHDTPQIQAAAHTLLYLAIAHQFFKGAQNVNVGLLRGLGNTKSGFHITLIGYWAIGVPAMLLAGYALDLGGPGIWIGLCLGFGATAVLLLRRFHRDLPTATTPSVLSAA
ncbi:MATE family efflux transporter [Sciscionella marina]|uniref:MATE family efflux transporter n=1 Tax=Sciscionella marina TaxID=508770 RepID=UPI00037297C2|nr:MATE family efflux transporter [Sciscionella marina]